MPIPPRPIPTTSNYRRRAARQSPPLTSSMGRRDSAFIAESRAEMALLPSLSVGSTPNSLRGVRLMHTPMGTSAPSSRPNTPPSHARPHEVPLASLMDGRGRPKRVGAASQLGFDFVARPEVMALSDDATVQAPRLTEPQPTQSLPSFWPWKSSSASNTSPSSAAASPVPTSNATAASLPPASGAPLPSTPALVPSLPDSDEDDDWEHVCAVEDDHIVGELELEEEQSVDRAVSSTGKDTSYATVTAREGKEVRA